MSYFFTSESVSEGHPDKLADQISDAILDNYLAFDPKSKVACETLVTTNQTVLAGEVKSNAEINTEKIVRETINKVGYTNPDYKFTGDSCNFNSFIHEQSVDINRGVDKINSKFQGAGDQGIMFGYATSETDDHIPLPLYLSHKLLLELTKLRKENKDIKYLRPDSKSQVTIEYDSNNNPKKIDTIIISTQHDEFDNSESFMLNKINGDIKNILIPRLIKNLSSNVRELFDEKIKYFVNPTGKFVIGGPHGDTGLTGRKIIVDTYGGKGAHGGGAFSGKDPSKVDRSAAYAARHIAKNIVAADIATEVLVQLSYAIGISKPTSIFIDTFGSSKIDRSDREISDLVSKIFDLTPFGIEKRLKLRNPIYQETSTYGHMGREPKEIKKIFNNISGKKIELDLELFTWEKLDYVELIKKTFK